MVGFEPTIYCTKNRCPTTRPHPKTCPLNSPSVVCAQDPFLKNLVWQEFIHLPDGSHAYVNQYSTVTSAAFDKFMCLYSHVYWENLCDWAR